MLPTYSTPLNFYFRSHSTWLACFLSDKTPTLIFSHFNVHVKHSSDLATSQLPSPLLTLLIFTYRLILIPHPLPWLLPQLELYQKFRVLGYGIFTLQSLFPHHTHSLLPPPQPGPASSTSHGLLANLLTLQPSLMHLSQLFYPIDSVCSLDSAVASFNSTLSPLLSHLPHSPSKLFAPPHLDSLPPFAVSSQVLMQLNTSVEEQNRLSITKFVHSSFSAFFLAKQQYYYSLICTNSRNPQCLFSTCRNG